MVSVGAGGRFTVEAESGNTLYSLFGTEIVPSIDFVAHENFTMFVFSKQKEKQNLHGLLTGLTSAIDVV